MTTKTLPRVSWNTEVWDENGTHYTQRITIDERTRLVLNDAIRAEISLGYPQKKKYAETSGDEIFFLKLLSISYTSKNNVVYLTLTQTRFVNLFLKLNVKRPYNSYLFIVEEK